MTSAAAPVSLAFRSVVRELGRVLPAGGGQIAGQGESPVEWAARDPEPARLKESVVIEGGALRAHPVEGDPEPGFDGFLDGTQITRVALHTPDGVPILYGIVAAVVRERRNRRMTTWGHRVAGRLYAPRSAVAPAVWRALEDTGVPVRDTSSADETSVAHPFAYRDTALNAVQHDRDRLEQELAEQWCGSADPGLLFVDGGIGGSEGMARSSCTVGVVKSHRTLYAEGPALRTILGLRRGWRSSVFRIVSAQRAPVASFYLRMRDPAGHDPMWGLVRVEIAHPARADEGSIGARANEVSRYILAESAPLSLPDGRWDKMVYGIRDCEEFLKAVGS